MTTAPKTLNLSTGKTFPLMFAPTEKGENRWYLQGSDGSPAVRGRTFLLEELGGTTFRRFWIDGRKGYTERTENGVRAHTLLGGLVVLLEVQQNFKKDVPNILVKVKVTEGEFLHEEGIIC